MRKLLPLLLILTAFYNPVLAQCDASFSGTVSGATVHLVSDTTRPGLVHKWKFGDGTQGFGSITSHTYAASGSYTVTQIVSDSLGCIDSALRIFTITVPVTCNASFVSQDSAGYHHFTSTSTAPGGSISSYQWKVNGAIVSAASSFTWQLPQGTNNICLTIQSTGGCSSTKCDTIVVDTSSNCNLNSSFNASVAGHIVTFTASDSTPRYLHTWKFGDGTQVTAKAFKVLHAYASPGTYIVTHIMKDSASNCVDSSKKTIIISVPVSCQASFVAMQDSVSAGTYHFFSTSTAPGASITSYQWTLNGIFVSSSSGFTKALPQGTNLVCLTITSSAGCTSSTCDSVIVDSAANCNLNAGFTKTVNFNVVNVRANDSGAHLLHGYKYGDGAQSFGRNGVHTYNAPGTYTITHYVTDSVSHCIDSAKQTVTITFPATCQASYNYRKDSVNKNKYIFWSTSTSSAGPIQSYNWKLNGKFESSASSFTTTLKKGPNVIQLSIITAGGCTSSITDTITVDSLRASDIPGLVASYPNPAEGGVVNLNLVLETQAKLKLTVYNSRGVIVFSEEKNYSAGYTRLSIPTHRLQRGQYYVDVQYGNIRKRSAFQKL